MHVKICGVRTLEGARACAEGGADMAGLNFVPSSRRAIDLDRAGPLIDALGSVTAVGIFQNQRPEIIETIADALGLGWVQLHGSEPPQVCARLAIHTRVIKALSADEALDEALCARYAPHVARFLIDGRQPGSGRPWAWGRLAPLSGQLTGRPMMLAGGLCPENISEAIASANPFGVDTASGVERDGVQDTARILAFCRTARTHTREDTP